MSPHLLFSPHGPGSPQSAAPLHSPRHALLTPNVALSVLGRHPEDRTAQLPKQAGPRGLRQRFLIHRDALPIPSGGLRPPHVAPLPAHGCGARGRPLAVTSSPSPRLAHPGSLASREAGHHAHNQGTEGGGRFIQDRTAGCRRGREPTRPLWPQRQTPGGHTCLLPVTLFAACAQT